MEKEMSPSSKGQGKTLEMWKHLVYSTDLKMVAWKCSKCFIRWPPLWHLWGRFYYYFHFIDEETNLPNNIAGKWQDLNKANHLQRKIWLLAIKLDFCSLYHLSRLPLLNKVGHQNHEGDFYKCTDPGTSPRGNFMPLLGKWLCYSTSCSTLSFRIVHDTSSFFIFHNQFISRFCQFSTENLTWILPFVYPPPLSAPKSKLSKSTVLSSSLLSPV